MTPRLLVALIAFVAVLGLAPALAQTYPTKPVRIIVPYPPGGGNDIVARALGQKLTESLGQNVLVENKPGGGTLIGAEAAAKAPPDGYTLFVGTIATMAINPSLYKEMPYHPVKDFAPIIHLVNYHMILVAHPDLPVKSVAELIAHAKANPGKLSYASFGSGSTPHLGTELLKTMTGIDMVHIPYKGGAPAIADLVGGQVPVMFIDTPPALTHIKAGKMRALAVSPAQRTALMPDLPTVGETVPGFGFTSWAGLYATAGTPVEVVTRLNGEINRILKLPDIHEQLSKLGADPVGGTPKDLADWMAAETTKWAKVVKDSGAKLD
ncbi:MAG: tripartite tricarboxylate transporter substrate binding protein [Rhodospirillales bacterium]|nr:tripartite tricarboxylate transporter substrate binding protein [Rhodospirillales bacterium]